MSSWLEKQTNEHRTLSVERRLMNEALARLDEVTLNAATESRCGRLIFGLDLTGSRQSSLRSARRATAGMFDTIKTLGSIAVKLIYYRGTDECRASKWHDDPSVLSDFMGRLSCDTGLTQIERLLRVALAEKEKISGLIFIGDHCEEDEGLLLALAETLGRMSMPLFVFHEYADHDHHALEAKPLFKRMAAASGGVYVEFKSDSSEVLRELLIGMGAFATAGHEGLKQIARPETTEARQLQARLLQLGPASDSSLKERK